jgi:hypothetical protein
MLKIMAYNNFTLDSVKHQFNLNLFDSQFCDRLPIAEPQSEFLTIINQWLPLAQRAKSEKAKSELLVSPILVEARRLVNETVQLFSGEEFNVDRDRGLNGFCDFVFSKSTIPFLIEAPVLMLSCCASYRREPPERAPLVEAKRGELDTGLGQCVAEMVAAQIFNLNEGKEISTIYSCVTSGKLWQFVKLEGSDVTIDVNEYQVTPVERILGILKWMLGNR